MKQIGITVLRCQPPHKGHISIIQNLYNSEKAKDGVYVFLCGNNYSLENPFSFRLRTEIFDVSFSKTLSYNQLHLIEAKNGFLPDLIKENIPNYKSYKLNIVVGQDRLDDFKDQLERTKFDGNYEIFYADSIKLNDSDEFRISGTSIREALINDDFNFVKSCLSENLGEKQFNIIYNLLRKEVGQWVRLKGNAFDSLKHINHIHKLKDDEFREWLLDLMWFQESNDFIEISEKVDGRMQMQFGVIDGKLYTKGKSDKLFFNAEDHTKSTFQEIHSILKKKEKKIAKFGVLVNGNDAYNIKILEDKEEIPNNFVYPQFFIEIIDSEVPNVIPYKKNQIILFKVSLNGFQIDWDEEFIIDEFLKLLGTSIIFNKNKWSIRKKNIYTIDDLDKINFNKWITLFDNRKETLLAVKHYVYYEIINKWIKDKKSKFGNKDGFIEGLVFQSDRGIVKVTDTNTFGVLKDILWHHREYLEDTIRNGFCKKIAKLSGIKSLWNKNLGSTYLKKQLNGEFIHKDIQNYIISQNAFTSIDKNNVIPAILYFLQETLNEIVKFNDEWIEYRDNPDNQIIKLGNRIVPFYQEIKDKTDFLISEHIEWYCELIRRFSKLNHSKINEDLKLTACLEWIYEL